MAAQRVGKVFNLQSSYKLLLFFKSSPLLANCLAFGVPIGMDAGVRRAEMVISVRSLYKRGQIGDGCTILR